MTKMKTHKGVAKRFRVTGTGKLKRPKPGLRHLLTKKRSSRKSKLSKPGLVDDAQLKMYKRLMQV